MSTLNGLIFRFLVYEKIHNAHTNSAHHKPDSTAEH